MRKKSKRRKYKVVNSLQDNKERIFHVHMLVESVGIVIKNKFYDSVSDSIEAKLFLSIFLMFHQISGSCSLKLFL